MYLYLLPIFTNSFLVPNGYASSWQAFVLGHINATAARTSLKTTAIRFPLKVTFVQPFPLLPLLHLPLPELTEKASDFYIQNNFSFFVFQLPLLLFSIDFPLLT